MSDPEDVPPPPTPEDVEAARQRVFESLPPEFQSNPEVRRTFGLGDAVERVARPIARVLGLKKCGGCKDRQDRLNDAGRRVMTRVRGVLGNPRNTG